MRKSEDQPIVILPRSDDRFLNEAEQAKQAKAIRIARADPGALQEAWETAQFGEVPTLKFHGNWLSHDGRKQPSGVSGRPRMPIGPKFRAQMFAGTRDKSPLVEELRGLLSQVNTESAYLLDLAERTAKMLEAVDKVERKLITWHRLPLQQIAPHKIEDRMLTLYRGRGGIHWPPMEESEQDVEAAMQIDGGIRKFMASAKIVKAFDKPEGFYVPEKVSGDTGFEITAQVAADEQLEEIEKRKSDMFELEP